MALLILALIILIIIFLVYASANISAGIYIKSYYRSKNSGKVVALTFDDGPQFEVTPALLDVLAEEEVKAAFFCIGEKVESNKDTISRIVKDGHLIGAHSYKHHYSLTYCNSELFKADLVKSIKVLEEASGEKVTWYRPPYGVTNPIMASVCRELKLDIAGWSVRSLDTMEKDYRKALNRVLKKVSPGSVILLHDRLPFAPELARRIIKELKRRGYSFERFDKLVKN